jgi:DNA polymerase-3 subunit epsilon
VTTDPVYFYLDTETSDYSEDTNPSLPVEIAYVLATEERILHAASFIINQTLWSGIRRNPIAERVSNIHGINSATTDRFGEPPDPVLHQFRRLLDKATQVVAHNISFDITVMNHAFAIQALPPINWPEHFCTMRHSAGILRIPSGGRHAIDGWKAPKLSEAYKHFSGREISGAHTGLADVFSCRLVHRGILQHARMNQPKTEPTETPT